MQAEHGQVFVVAASHLIFRLRQPSQALITVWVLVFIAKTAPATWGKLYLSAAYGGCARQRTHSLANLSVIP